MLDKVIHFIVSKETIFKWIEMVVGECTYKLSNRLIVGVAIVWVANKGSV